MDRERETAGEQLKGSQEDRREAGLGEKEWELGEISET